MIVRSVRYPFLTAVAAAVLVIGLLPATARPALTSVTVAAGSVAAGSTVSLNLAATTTPVLTNNSSGASSTCAASSTAGAQTTVGSGLSPTALIKIASSTFSSCTPFAITQTGTWNVDVTSTTSSGTTGFKIANVRFHASGGNCAFDAAGSLQGTYTNGNPSKITYSATGSTVRLYNLVISGGAVRCTGGTYQNNSLLTLTASYNVTASGTAANPVTVVAT